MTNTSTVTMINTNSNSNVLWDLVGAEAVLVACFLLGYLVFSKFGPRANRSGLAEKQMAADFNSGNYDAVLTRSPCTVDMLEMCVQSLVALGRAGELPAYLRTTLTPALRTSAALQALLAAVPAAQLAAVKDAFAEAGVGMDEAAAEVVVAAYLKGADVPMLDELPLNAKTLSKLVRDALKKQDLDLALARMRSMQDKGMYVPQQFLAQFARLNAKRGRDFVGLLVSIGAATGEALSGMVEACCKDAALEAVERIAAFADEQRVSLTYEAHDAMLKAHARANDPRAFRTLEAMQAAFQLTEQTAMQVVALCAHSKDVPLAEAVVAAAPKSLPVYSALMRVYAFARLFHKTCDLYPTVVADGLEPDNVMYGCLIKAAVECGRVDLSRQFLRQSKSLDIQNYMSLFRACAREKDAKKVLELLQELEESPVAADTTAYNCVLDVCFKSGDQAAAKALFAKMKAQGYVDVISFNTLIKGLGATVMDTCLQEMREIGIEPNQITYNSLINSAVSSGNMSQAWKYVSVMKLEGIAVDGFTVSTMMKGLRTSASRDDVDNTLRLLEGGVQVDEVLVNTLVDACIRLRDIKRLTAALRAFRSSGVVPSENAYATVLRAYGMARAVEEAAQTWAEMLSHKVWPKDSTVAVVVEALLQSGAVDAALSALRAYVAACPHANPMPGYAALAKGLAQRKDAAKALELLSEVKSACAELSTELYNALIDVFARSGDMEHAAEVFKAMCASSAPNLATYATVIKGYCVQGEMEQAIQLFMLMRKRNVAPDAAVFNAILDGCARKEMATMVEQILADMESAGVPMSAVTLAIVVKCYCKAGSVELALEAVESMPAKHNFVPSEQVYLSLLAGCVRSGRLEDAEEAFRKLASPDSKAFGMLIHGYLKQDVAKAASLAEAAMLRGMLEASLLESVRFMAARRQLRLPAVLKAAGPEASRFHEKRRQGQTWRG